MLLSYTKVTDRAALLAATSNHTFVRFSTRARSGVAYVGPTATVWSGGGPERPMVGAVGSGPAVLDLVAALRADGQIAAGTRAELPRMDPALVAAAFGDVRVTEWDLRWLERTPAMLPGEERVIALTTNDHDEINRVLDAALPDAHNRPGSERVYMWYGIRDGADLVAVAADSAMPGFGFINSIAVRPDRHGQGLGGALTSSIARRQLADTDTVLLGVMADNVHASRLYHRLGFTGVHKITAFTLR